MSTTETPNISEAQLAANRANAKLSTGPRTEAGKAISSRNRLVHGFTGAFCVLPGEDSNDYYMILEDMETEHKPVTPTEHLLVTDMARHHWLVQRALRLQEDCFVDDLDDSSVQRKLSLYIRYQGTHQRAFHRCFNDLLKIRKERVNLQRSKILLARLPDPRPRGLPLFPTPEQSEELYQRNMQAVRASLAATRAREQQLEKS